MKLIVFSIFLIYTTQISGQQINGIWKGKMFDPNSNADTVIVEIVITGKKNNSLSGNSICHFTGGIFSKTTITGKFDPLKNEVFLAEKQIVNTNFRDPSILFLDEYHLILNASGKLTGFVRCIGPAKKNPDFYSSCHNDKIIELVKD